MAESRLNDGPSGRDLPVPTRKGTMAVFKLTLEGWEISSRSISWSLRLIEQECVAFRSDSIQKMEGQFLCIWMGFLFTSMDLENIRSYNMGKYGVSPPLIISGCKFRSRWWWDGPLVGLGLMAMRK